MCDTVTSHLYRETVLHLRRRLLRLDPEKAMTVLRRAVNVSEGSAVGQILSDEADLVDRMVVEAILEIQNQ